MKKILISLFALLLISTLSISTFAISDADFVSSKEFSIASFNGVRTFIGDSSKTDLLEDASLWLIDNANLYNTKYVSFIGNVAKACKYQYSMIANGTITTNDITPLSLADPDWNSQYKAFSEILKGFTGAGIPVGVSTYYDDYVASGFKRDSLQSTYMSVDNLMPNGTAFDYHNDSNYCVYFENNGTKYVIFQLELWPRTTTLNWFDDLMKANSDRYAIVYTTSFIDTSGAMYTMWDWNGGFVSVGTTRLKSFNLTWDDMPRDGQGIWDYSFSQFDNILAVVSSNVSTSSIITSKATNPRGIETALIGANADYALNKEKPHALLTKFSADNTKITCVWATEDGIKADTLTSVSLNKIGELKIPEIDNSLPKIKPQYNGANDAYMLGYSDNTFRPDNEITKAEACTVFARLLLGANDIPNEYNTRFKDVRVGDWFHNAIAFLDESGYFYRYEGDTYNPNEPITRAEFVELANLTSSLVSKNRSVTFTDVSEDDFYYKSIIAAAGSGLVNGYEDGTFRPDNTIKRAEAVTVINRLLGLEVSERTVSPSRLDNNFSDTATHWARLQILMASNSSVHGDYYYDADLDGVTEEENTMTFENAHFSFTVKKTNGKVIEIINKHTGESIFGASANNYFIYLTNKNGSTVSPAMLESDILKKLCRLSTPRLVLRVRRAVHTRTITSPIPTIT